MSNQAEAQEYARILNGAAATDLTPLLKYVAAELLRQEALIAELEMALEACSQYLVCIPESAAGGDDEACRINRRAIAALEKVKQ